MPAAAVAEADSVMEKSPPMFNELPGMVLTPLPLRISVE